MIKRSQYVSCSLMFIQFSFTIIMPPTSKKLRGHIGLGLSVQSVSQSVSQSVMREQHLALGQEPLEVGS